MRKADFSLQAIRDPRLAVHAAAAAPAWVWTGDGARVIWANAAGVSFFGAQDDDTLAARTFSLADTHRRQVAQLSGRLPVSGAVRLERLRGFGAAPGMLTTCVCSRISFPGGENGVLIAGSQTPRRVLSFHDRLITLIDSLDRPAAAFTHHGDLIAANAIASAIPDFESGGADLLNNLSRAELSSGKPLEISTPFGQTAIHPVGHDAELALIALLPSTAVAGTRPAAPVVRAAPAPRTVIPPKPRDIVPSPIDEPRSVTDAQTADVEVPSTDQIPEAAPLLPIEPETAPDVVAPVEVIHDESDAAVAAVPRAEDAALPQDVSASTSVDLSAFIPSTPSPSPTPPSSTSPHPTSMSDESDFEDQDHVAPPAATFADLPDNAPVQRRRHPLRFTWQMDADGHFSFGSDEFTKLIGTHTAAAFGRLWDDVADALELDPERRVAAAVQTRNTFSGIIVQWPVDGFGARLPVELSGLPLFDRNRVFAGYRGFGICRDLDGLTRIAAQRRHDTLFSAMSFVKSKEPMPKENPPATPATDNSVEPAAMPDNFSQPPAPDDAVASSVNVVPFRPASVEPKPPALTPVENSAFQEIARQLSERLESEAERILGHQQPPAEAAPSGDHVTNETSPATEAPSEPVHADVLHVQPERPAAKTSSAPDTQLFDKLPTGVLIYQLDRLIYANRAFLKVTGYDSLTDLTEDGGLDALYVEASSTDPAASEGGSPITISTARMGQTPGVKGRLHSISWAGDSALSLMLSPPDAAAAPAVPQAVVQDVPPPSSDDIQAEELAAILETTAEGVVMFDGLGRISGCNRSAEALFNRAAADITEKNLIDLFAPESQRALLDYLESIKSGDAQSVLDHGRDVLARTPDGGVIPLSITMGRTRPVGPRYFAVFRDRTPVQAPIPAPATVDTDSARRSSEKMASAKADMLARLSHEIRMPVNAIIGFADVMIDERFGALGNERYVDYMKDIRASGERVIAIIDDMLDLSRIESGKLDLAFSNQDLNALVEQCVAVMQPQANRERIIIRSSLTHGLPQVRADARALRQIALNLIGCSIHFANAGGQVIVSTAVTDLGDVTLRIRDTGQGLNDNEIAAAMAPFRTPSPDEVAHENSANLSLTKALVEANRGRFHIKSAPNSGTLIEVMFDQASATA